ncbi:MAG: response regulator [Coleofasciculus sp. S288]|nr:response regulator [Coleofasciculus sp. S288]
MQPEEKVNVLLVDDHPENLLALEAILGSLGQNLVRANSGAEALRCLLQQDFAVILLDVHMPEMDGFETATLIRNRERSRFTPIIFLTAFSKSEKLMFKGYSLGAVDYLFKPIEPEILLSKVSVFVELFKKTAEVKRQATQLAAVNAELRESEERFRSLSACSPVGIFLTDVEGRCTYTNPRCQGICGLTFEESLGDGWLRYVHQDDRDRVLKDWLAWTLTNCEYSNEFRFHTSDGLVRYVQVRTSPMFSAQGKLIGHVGTIEDITERKEAEEARAQVIREQAARQQAEATNRMKDEFLATLSHELRTPLNSILGWAQLLRTRDFAPDTMARALETIERNAKSQAQLIEDILDVSRLIRGKLRLNLCSVDLVPLMETVMDSVRPAADAKGLQLETIVNFPASREVKGEASSNENLTDKQHRAFTINGDPDRLQQIAWNLISNALKFTPTGGKVSLWLEYTDSYAQIRVSDTGIGISKEFLPHVFDRFRQADSTTTRTHGGLGLGLSIVRHLVELHGGTIQAESEGEGKGAIFTVKLPLHKRAEQLCNTLESDQSFLKTEELELTPEQRNGSVTSSINVSSILAGLQILVVDDEADVREVLTSAIEGSGAKVIAVSSVPEALNVLEQMQLDVLVSDIGLPLEDGCTLIRKVRDREAQQGRQLPAVALTGYAREEDCQQAIASGFQMHMSKPVDTTQLVMVVANLAGRSLNGVALS